MRPEAVEEPHGQFHGAGDQVARPQSPRFVCDQGQVGDGRRQGRLEDGLGQASIPSLAHPELDHPGQPMLGNLAPALEVREVGATL
jgi:hypothetical protein